MQQNYDEFLGKKAQDKETGYTGIVTAYCVYAYAPTAFLLEAVDSTGRPIEWWVNISRMKILDDQQ